MKQGTRKKQWMIFGVVLLLSFSFLLVIWNNQKDEDTVGSVMLGNITDASTHVQIEKKDPVEEEPKEETTIEEPKKEQTSEETTPNVGNNQTQEQVPTRKEESVVPVVKTVQISIDMKNILQHMDKVSDNVKRFIPADGIVLSTINVEIQEGDSVYQVLQKACETNQIPLIANNGYVKFIKNVGEFDAGNTSGWLYQVNGVSPSIGANSYKVKEHDIITWRYSVIQGDI